MSQNSPKRAWIMPYMLHEGKLWGAQAGDLQHMSKHSWGTSLQNMDPDRWVKTKINISCMKHWHYCQMFMSIKKLNKSLICFIGSWCTNKRSEKSDQWSHGQKCQYALRKSNTWWVTLTVTLEICRVEGKVHFTADVGFPATISDAQPL